MGATARAQASAKFKPAKYLRNKEHAAIAKFYSRDNFPLYGSFAQCTVTQSEPKFLVFPVVIIRICGMYNKNTSKHENEQTKYIMVVICSSVHQLIRYEYGGRWGWGGEKIKKVEIQNDLVEV